MKIVWQGHIRYVKSKLNRYHHLKHYLFQDAIWISPFRAVAKEINHKCLQQLVSAGKCAYRSIALHNTSQGSRTVQDLEQYFKYSDVQEYGATYVDLAIGSRVRCTHNLATELGNRTCNATT